MNLLNGHGGSIRGRFIAMPRVEPEFEVSWVGEDPIRGHYCFGSMDGRLLFREPGSATWLGPVDVAPSREAINGVAFEPSSFVVSTREDVTCVRHVDNVDHVATIPQGAHGVCVSSRGEYYAPVGQRGLLRLESKPEHLSVSILSPDAQGTDVYFYRVASLSSPNGRESLACALRRGGFAVLPLRGFDPEHPPRLVRTGADIIDVCSLGMAAHPLAAVGLGMDCSIHLVRDAFTERSVKTLRFPAIQDRAYRVLCAEGHVFLLTNKRLCVFVNLASGFLKGVTEDPLTEVRFLETEAIDMGLTTNRSLIVIEPERVLEVDIGSLVSHQGQQASSQGVGPSHFSQDEEAWSDIPASSWKWNTTELSEVQFVAGASV